MSDQTNSEEVVPPLPTKHPRDSKTVIGLSISAFCTLLLIFGIADISPDDQANLIEASVGLVVAVTNLTGLAIALYGRWKAKQPLGL